MERKYGGQSVQRLDVRKKSAERCAKRYEPSCDCKGLRCLNIVYCGPRIVEDLQLVTEVEHVPARIS